jgi:hypothetical protein
MAKKNFLKDFDYKKFLIEKGEQAGLGLAVGVCVLMLVLGSIVALTAGSPQDNAEKLEKGTRDIKNKLEQAKPADDYAKVDPALLKPIDARQVKPDEVACLTAYFEAAAADAAKRHPPVILSAVESHVELVRTQVRIHMIQREGLDEPMIMVIKDAQVKDKHQADSARGNWDRFGGGRGLGGAPPGGRPGRPGPNRGNNSGDLKGAFDSTTASKEQTLVPVKLNELTDQKLAVDIRPFRMAYVVASFPYREQMEEFKKSLGFRTLRDLFSDREVKIRFLGFNVERQTLRPDAAGKLTVVEDWRPLDLKTEYQQGVLLDAVAIAPDEAKLKPVLVPGLAVPRPQLPHDSQGYRVYKGDKLVSPEELLPKIQQALTDWSKKDKETKQRVMTAQGEKLQGAFDLFDPESERKPQEKKPDEEKPEETNKGQEDLQLPAHCVVRFLDPTIEAGNYYKYRIQVKMANPNYVDPKDRDAERKKALVADEAQTKVEFLTAKQGPDGKPATNGKDYFYELQEIVQVPNDLYMYTVDPKAYKPRLSLDKDTTVVQIHRWLEQAGPTMTTPPARKFPVGDWMVAERVRVQRGEMIGHWIPLKVPVWSPERESFVFLPPPGKRSGSVPVDFRVRAEGQGAPAVMVDFEGGTISESVPVGGKSRSVSDEGPIQQLILTSDGKLVVHDSKKDMENPEREARYKYCEKDQKDVQEAVDTINNGGKKPDRIQLDNSGGK